MRKNGWILLLILICVAFLVSCGKKNTAQAEKGELVKMETAGEFPCSFAITAAAGADRGKYCRALIAEQESIDLYIGDWYNRSRFCGICREDKKKKENDDRRKFYRHIQG